MKDMLAGLLRMSGQDRARLPGPSSGSKPSGDWRRFHSWVLEFYMEVLFQPLVYYGARFLPHGWVLGVSLFLSFAVGTAVSHYVHYISDWDVALALGIVFGVAVLAHFAVIRAARRWCVSVKFSGRQFPSPGLPWGFSTPSPIRPLVRSGVERDTESLPGRVMCSQFWKSLARMQEIFFIASPRELEELGQGRPLVHFFLRGNSRVVVSSFSCAALLIFSS